MKNFILKIYSLMNKVLPYDKAIHFIFGGLLFFIITILNFIAGGPIGITVTLSVAATFLLTLFKEAAVDHKMFGEEVDYLDVLASVCGGLAVGVVELVMYYMHNSIVVY